MRPTRRKALALGGAALAGTAGCLGLGSGGGGGPTPTEADLSGPVVSAPIPENTDDYTYAVMGSADAPVTATYVGNWKCPFCADFSTGNLPGLVEDYVATGDVLFEYRALSSFLGEDAFRAGRAGLAVWNVDPERYWAFHEYVMANQPPEGQNWATVDRLSGMANAASVSDTETVRSALENGDYEGPVSETTNYASANGIRSTPTLVVDGRTVNPLQEQPTRNLIEGAIESA